MNPDHPRTWIEAELELRQAVPSGFLHPPSSIVFGSGSMWRGAAEPSRFFSLECVWTSERPASSRCFSCRYAAISRSRKHPPRRAGSGLLLLKQTQSCFHAQKKLAGVCSAHEHTRESSQGNFQERFNVMKGQRSDLWTPEFLEMWEKPGIRSFDSRTISQHPDPEDEPRRSGVKTRILWTAPVSAGSGQTVRLSLQTPGTPASLSRSPVLLSSTHSESF